MIAPTRAMKNRLEISKIKTDYANSISSRLQNQTRPHLLLCRLRNCTGISVSPGRLELILVGRIGFECFKQYLTSYPQVGSCSSTSDRDDARADVAIFS
jgi:hypothetical protein